VIDNGTGIPASIIDRVFDKGETDAASAGGMGMGLAIVKTFAEAHGGGVAVESREGSRATLRFTLPSRDAAARCGKRDSGSPRAAIRRLVRLPALNTEAGAAVR
jgi:signal transduction histidine kinase